MVEYLRAIKRPFQDIPTLIIGIILGMIPIVGLLTSGFSLRAAKATLKGDNKLPKWEDWGDLISKSLAVFVITLVYLIPAAILFLLGAIVGVGGTVLSVLNNPSALFAAILGGGVLLLAAFILAVLALLFSPVGAINYLKTGKLSKAFALGEVAKKAFTGKYLVAWLFIIVYCVVLFVVTIILRFIPVAGAFLGSGISNFLGNVTSMTVFAEAYKEIK